MWAGEERLKRILIKSGTWSHNLRAVYTSNLDQEENWGGDVLLWRRQNIIEVGLFKETNSNLRSPNRLGVQIKIYGVWKLKSMRPSILVKL